MKIINTHKVEQFLDRVDFKETVFVFDFDGTITTTGNAGSFSPVAKTQTSAREYMNTISSYYHPVEKSSSFDDIFDTLNEHDKILTESGISFYDFRDILMQQRWDLTMLVGVKFNLDIDNYSVEDGEFRKGMRTFLESLYSKQFEVLIVSAGVKNYIVNFFTYHGFDMARMNIVGNEFETDDGGKAIGYDKNLITAYTKQHLDYKQYGISDKEFAIQFGDSLGDAHIVNDHFKKENILTVGITGGDTGRDKSFCELFDIVLETEDGEIDEILKLLKN